MRNEQGNGTGWARGLALAGIAVAGILMIVGSGGGVGFVGPDCGQLQACGPLPPTVEIEPARITVQVGAGAAFTARSTGVADPTYQWQRSADGGNAVVDIVGATAAKYTIAAANLGDDAAVLRVLVRERGSGATVAQQTSRLTVSSAPGVVFQDADFAAAEWQVSETSVPANNGAVHTEEHVASGGNPDAFRRMTHAFPPTQQSLGVMNLSTSAVYDPAASGAIYVIDYTEDCALLSAGNPTFGLRSTLLIEQAGRRYQSTLLVNNSCTSAAWSPLRGTTSLAAADFDLLDGPACAGGDACPDFSVSAPPLRFGFVRFAQANSTPTVHAIDNWTVTVWRR